MKRISAALLCLIFSFKGFSQYDSTKILQAQLSYGYQWKNGRFTGSLLAPTDTVKMAVKDSGGIVTKNNIIYVWDGYKWKGSSPTFSGGPISSLPAIGNDPGTNITSKDFIVSQFYASQPPTAGLSGGGTYENTSASTLSASLSWTAGRQSATANLASIVVNGVTQSFTNPGQPGSVSGSQAVSVPTNTTTTYTNTVTTSDAKTASATTSFYYRDKYYIGYVSSGSPSDANIIAAGGSFASSRITSGNLADPSSASYILFAYPASFGTATIKIGGLVVGFNLTTRSFVNASGYSTSYNIYTSPYPTNSGASYEIQ